MQNSKKKTLLLTRILGVLSGSLKRIRSPEFDGKTSSNTMSHHPPAIPFGYDMRNFWKKYLSTTKSAVTDPRQTVQRSNQTQQRQSVLRLDLKKFLEQPFTRHYTLHFNFKHIQFRSCIELRKPVDQEGKLLLCPCSPD